VKASHASGLVLLALLAAGCGASSPPAPHATAFHPAPAPAPAGPFTITVDHCGRLTHAQQVRFTTNAKAGLILTAADRSGGARAIPFTVQADFLHGSELMGQNTTGVSPAITQGQTEKLEIDSPPGWGPGDTCKIVAYTVFQPGSVTPAGTYQVKG
jgi:hypothetical protein